MSKNEIVIKTSDPSRNSSSYKKKCSTFDGNQLKRLEEEKKKRLQIHVCNSSIFTS